jgi:hypothetical protein
MLPIRTSSEGVGIGRAIDSSVRQPGSAQVQQIRKKLCAAVPGAGIGRRAPAASFAVQVRLGKLKGRYRGF